MILYKTALPLQQNLAFQKQNGKIIGFIPTMGALHNGHLSLIEKSKLQCDITMCSIFVNPTQFNDKTDFEKYPVTIEKDIQLLEKSGADILFYPVLEEIYPHGLQTYEQYALGNLENILEGYYRPGHFKGVCQVVHRLLNIIMPDKIFMGQKDFQQCMVIKKLIEQFNIKTKLEIEPTLRETDGLAMSSRNQRLNEDARKKSTAIFKALSFVKENITTTNFTSLTQQAADYILSNGFTKVDYVAICNADNLETVNTYNKDLPLVVLAAAFINNVRLIDNLIIQ